MLLPVMVQGQYLTVAIRDKPYVKNNRYPFSSAYFASNTGEKCVKNVINLTPLLVTVKKDALHTEV